MEWSLVPLLSPCRHTNLPQDIVEGGVWQVAGPNVRRNERMDEQGMLATVPAAGNRLGQKQGFVVTAATA